MKMQCFHQEGGRTPGTPYAGSATVKYHSNLITSLLSRGENHAGEQRKAYNMQTIAQLEAHPTSPCGRPTPPLE